MGIFNRKNNTNLLDEEFENPIDAAIITASFSPSARAKRKENRQIRRQNRKKNASQNWNRVRALIANPKYRKGFIQRHFKKQEEVPMEIDETFENTYSPDLKSGDAFVDLSKDAYVATSYNAPEDAITALGSEFMESKNPSVFKAGKFKTLPADYMLRDWKDMPLGDISLFHGVENGTYKVMPLSQFNDSTTVVPVRTPYGWGGLTSVSGTENYEEKMKEFDDKKAQFTEPINKLYSQIAHEKDSLWRPIYEQMKPELKKHGIRTYSSIVDENPKRKVEWEIQDSLRNTNIPYWKFVDTDEPFEVSPRTDSLRSLYKWLKTFPSYYDLTSEKIDSLNNALSKAQDAAWKWEMENEPPKETTFTFENDSTSHEIPFANFGKFTLGNSKGGFYINNERLLNNNYIRKRLNDFIQSSGEPLYPVLLDNGAFSEHVLDTIPQQGMLRKYLDQGYGVTDDNIFVIGTRKPSKKKGGILLGKSGIPSIIRTNDRLKYKKYNNGECTGEDACAAWSNQQLRDLGADIYSNAWSLEGDIENVISGFDGLTRPSNYNRFDLEMYNGRASDNLKNNPNLYSMLDPNEAYAVNMYYKDSPSLWKAFSSGRDTGTHTGMLIFNNDKQDWEVVHNIHGKLYVDDLINTLGSGKQYGITSIYKTNIPDKPVGVDFNKYLYK